MTTFQDVLNKINIASQIVQATEPAFELFANDHAAGTQQLLQIAGAGAASLTTDTNVQNEIVQSAQLASTFVPLVFALFKLFHHKSTTT